MHVHVTADTRAAALVAPATPITRRGAILAALTLSGALAVAMPADARPAPVETPGPLAAGILQRPSNPFESDAFDTVDVSEIEEEMLAFLQGSRRRPRMPYSAPEEVAWSLSEGGALEGIERERRQYHDALRRQRARLIEYLRLVEPILAESPALPAELLP